MSETTDGPEDVATEQSGAEAHRPDAAEEPVDNDATENQDPGMVHRLRTEAAEASQTDADGDDWRNLHRMLDVPLALTVELGGTEMPLSEVLRLEGGSVITLDRMPGDAIDLLINGRVFARGEVVVVDDTFGFRITELMDDADGAIEIGGVGG